MAAAQNDSRPAYPPESATLLGVVLDALAISIAIVDADGRLVAFNSAWRHLTLQITGRNVKAGVRGGRASPSDRPALSSPSTIEQVVL